LEGDQPITRPHFTGQHTTERHEHTCMYRTEFEPTILVFERSKIVRPLGPYTIKCKRRIIWLYREWP